MHLAASPHVQVLLRQITPLLDRRAVRHLGTRHRWQVRQVLQHLDLDLLQLFARVGVLHVAHSNTQALRVQVVVVLSQGGFRQVVRQVQAHHAAGLVRPASRHVAQRVASPAQHQHGHVVLLQELQAVAVALQAQVEAAQPVAAQAVSSTAHHNGLRLEHLHHLGHDGLIQHLVAVVVHTVLERHIDGVALALAGANVVHCTCTREELAVLVEAHRHDPVRQVEGLLHTIAVVDVNVHVQHPRIHLEQLQDAEHNVVHVAEAGRLGLLGVMHTT
mmetsp:Transcript_11210/g.24142  ORF Transcript_11210/g.24142 Transcript_11210/m.24142 type:complete len:274 (+) Transcript_11210:1586-2407(+)